MLLRPTSLLIRKIWSSWDGLSNLICMKLINIFVINIILVCQNHCIPIIKLTHDLSVENLPLKDEDMKNLKIFDIILWSNMSMSTYNLLKKHFLPELSMLSIFMLQAKISRLSHVTEVSYNCCVNTCCCFTRTHAGLNSCPFCKHTQHNSEGHSYKSTNIYLLNHTSNHSTWWIAMLKSFTTALFPEAVKLMMSSMWHTIKHYVGHRSWSMHQLQRLLELIEINLSPQSFKCVGLIAISQITSISIQCLMCLRWLGG